MKQIKIFDTTLRDGEQSPGCSMNLAEKLEMAKQLEKLGVDVIEAGFAISSQEDFESVRSIADTVKKSTVASLSRALKKDIDRAYDAVRTAVNPRIHVFLATSDVHMKYKLRMTREQVLRSIEENVSYAASLCEDVEFSAEDALRSDPEFLVQALSVAVANGAKVINVPDTVGYTTPEEMYERISYLRENIANVDKVDISTHCHNDLGMATANSLAAMRAGATQIECTVNGIGERAGNAALEEIVMGIKTRESFFNAYTNIDTTRIYHTSRMLSAITGITAPPNKAIIGANAFAHESGIHQHGVMAERTTYEIMTPQSIGIPENKMVLGKHSGRHAFADRLISLGYHLNAEETDQAFARFKALADKKKVVDDRDIEAIAVQGSLETKQTLELEDYTVNIGTKMTPTASVSLKVSGEVVRREAQGDGPVDAVFKAVDMVAGTPRELESYTLRSVGEGEDAMGEAIVKLKHNGGIVTGRGLSTDIIEASILAYLDALSRIM